jgi:hypothetical protein
MASGDTIRNSILCEHTIKVAQHDHSKLNDTLGGYRRTVSSKRTLAELNRCRRKILASALNLGFLKKLLAKDHSE